MASSSTKRQKTCQGKFPTDDVPVPNSQAMGIEDVLDYSRYFSSKCQMVVYKKKFHGILVLSSKAMHFPFFVALGFQFEQHLNFQGSTTH